MRENNAKAILEANTQAVPSLLGENPVVQAVQVPAVEQVLQFVMRLEQVTQADPLELGNFSLIQVAHLLLVQAEQLMTSCGVLQPTQDAPPVIGINPSEQAVQAFPVPQSVQLVIEGLQVAAEAEAISAVTANNEKSLFISFLRIVDCNCL